MEYNTNEQSTVTGQTYQNDEGRLGPADKVDWEMFDKRNDSLISKDRHFERRPNVCCQCWLATTTARCSSCLKYWCDDNKKRIHEVQRTPQPNQPNRREGQWTHRYEFFFTALAATIGYGNLWRFPYKAYDNGGGAFVIPYLIIMVIIGFPILVMELGIGQFSGKNSVAVWDCVPALRGIGYMQICGCFMVVSYYAYLVALGLHFMLNSIADTLPYAVCHNESKDLGEPKNMTCFAKLDNKTNGTGTNLIAAEPDYVWYYFLHSVPNWNDGPGVPIGVLVGCVFFVYVLAYITLWKGLTTGKTWSVFYLVAMWPYVMVIALLIKVVGLEGASDGIEYFFTPDLSEMIKLKTWFEAFTQMFFSLSLGFGTMILFGSLNPLFFNTVWDAMMFCLIDAIFSIISGVMVFAIIGHVVHVQADSEILSLSSDVEEHARKDPTLPYIAFAQGINLFKDMPQIFAIFFFMGLLSFGLSALVGLLAPVLTVVHDEFFPKIAWAWTTLLVLFVQFSISIIYTTEGGMGILSLIDSMAGSFTLFFAVIFEVMGIAWGYGAYNFLADLEFMYRRHMRRGWKFLYWYFFFSWTVFLPTSCVFMFIYLASDFRMPVYIDMGETGDIEFSGTAKAGYWILGIIIMSWVPIVAVYYLCLTDRIHITKRCRRIVEPNEKWGPQEEGPETVEDWKLFRTKKKFPNRKKQGPIFKGPEHTPNNDQPLDFSDIDSAESSKLENTSVVDIDPEVLEQQRKK